MLATRYHTRNIHRSENLRARKCRSLRSTEYLHLLWLLNLWLGLWLHLWLHNLDLRCLDLWLGLHFNLWLYLWLHLRCYRLLLDLRLRLGLALARQIYLAENLWLLHLLLNLDGALLLNLWLDAHRRFLVYLLTDRVQLVALRTIFAILLLQNSVGVGLNLRVRRRIYLDALAVQEVNDGVESNIKLLGYPYKAYLLWLFTHYL